MNDLPAAMDRQLRVERSFQIPRKEYQRTYTASPISQRYYTDVHVPYAYDPVFSTPDVYTNYITMSRSIVVNTLDIESLICWFKSPHM